MARFTRKGSKSELPHEPDENLLKSPSTDSAVATSQRLSSTISDHKVFSTILAFLPTKTSPPPPRLRRTQPRIKHIPIEVSPYHISQIPFDCAPKELKPPTSPTTPRRPRHVPIIIPDFAQPYLPESVFVSPIDGVFPTSKQNLRRVSRIISPIHGSNSDSLKSSEERKKEVRPLLGKSEHLSKMNSSQVSLSTASESGTDNANIISRSTSHAGNGNLGITSPISQSGGVANLSGLVCNVHRTTGEEPHALVGATTTILGDKLYVFGGRIHSRTKPQLTSDLYELDLLRRHWTKLDVTGEIPPPRYFHSVCALGDSKLVCYGGMSPAPHLRNLQNRPPQPADGQPEVVVMSDIHVFDVLKRKWFLVSGSTAGTEGPQGRYAHCAAILPSSAVFSSSSAPHSAIHHNRPTTEGDSTHSGTLGVQLDGSGGAEMIVVGGQDSANNYIEQISVFNLRSLKWTNTTAYDHKCGAYKSMVAPLIGLDAENIGKGIPLDDQSRPSTGTSTLIYSNYNFLEVKLELQVRLPDGTLIERPMRGKISPPGLRFPNGGIINSHFVVSGTYLTSSKHEYALWALDLRTLTWGRIDTAGSVFSQASWNRGILWNRRNTFVILGHRKRNLVDDYNHRRINFSHVCMVELEAFGLYENPRRTVPTSAYISVSSPAIPASLQPSLASTTAGGRKMSSVAEQLGQTALMINEVSDMELVAVGGERIPCNSHVLARRWGPYFNNLLMESSTQKDSIAISEATTLRNNMHSQASRNSTLTITPSGSAAAATAAVTNNGPDAAPQAEGAPGSRRTMSQSTNRTLVDMPNSGLVPASTRPRALYLPHTAQTIRLLLHYLYTSSLPQLSSSLCSPHTLCSLLQMARPYQIDGLLEATVQRLHEVLDGRNAAAVFNAAAMAAGGGRGTGTGSGGTLAALERRESEATTVGNERAISALSHATANLRINERSKRGHGKTDSVDSGSTTTSASTSTGVSHTDTESTNNEGEDVPTREKSRGIWTGDMSSVIGLQKRGLRGLMEGRRLRERANTGNGE